MKRLLSLLLVLLLGGAGTESLPVTVIADGRLVVADTGGRGVLPTYISADWIREQAEVTRVLVFIHDASRDAELSLRIAYAARYAAGTDARTTILVVPQFLAEPDLTAHHLAQDVLHWTMTGWSYGEAALGPAAISSFSAVDAILARLADPAIFPALRRVVIVGYGAGAQLVQRYAVVGRRPAALEQRGIAVRYVAAEPSSYLWFGADRPNATASVACEAFDHWPYNLAGAPDYVDATAGLEERYIKRDVIYLLAEGDPDEQRSLSGADCAIYLQGPTRYARGMNYLFALELRHPNLVRHRVLSVWHGGQGAGSILLSPCGLAALFDRAGCAAF